jgi:hypothetical protein
MPAFILECYGLPAIHELPSGRFANEEVVPDIPAFRDRAIAVTRAQKPLTLRNLWRRSSPIPGLGTSRFQPQDRRIDYRLHPATLEQTM